MKKVLFLTKYPSPYRVEFFNILGRYVDLTVLFEQSVSDQKHRNRSWFNTDYTDFKAVFLNCKNILHQKYYPELAGYLRADFDEIVICGYAMPAEMAAIDYLKRHGKSYFIEVDGIVEKPVSILKTLVKKHYIKGAAGYFSSGVSADNALVRNGALKESIIRYNFSSLRRDDILCKAVSSEARSQLRKDLGISEDKVAVSVGQLIYRKGFDILTDSARKFKNIGFYIIGGIPNDDERSSVPDNVHFFDYMDKSEIFRYYKAADCYICPSRYDIWGLVINEAMANSLPIIASDKTGAALELVRDGENGYIFKAESSLSLSEKIGLMFSDDNDIAEMSLKSLEAIADHTIEDMVRTHLTAFGV